MNPAAKELLFPTPIYTASVADAARLNKALIEDIHALMGHTRSLQRSNQNGWHSENDFFQRPEESFRQLGRVLIQSAQAIMLDCSPDLDMAKYTMQGQGWINVNPKGGYNAPHDHPGFHWSGCYYVQVPPTTHDRSGMIEFLDTRTNLQANGMPVSSSFAPKVRKRPKAGQFYTFPSYLRHWVYPNEEEAERISIAFNLRLVPASSSAGAG
jgi:uncharacterized protein (TIGR02466 family)